MARVLHYVLVETGPCTHCHRDAGDHSVEGLCGPLGTTHERHADAPEPCYRGTSSYAFVDLESAEALAIAQRVAVVT